MNQTWEHKVCYVDFRGRISSEGAEYVRKPEEHRSGFVRKYLDVLGAEGWELVGIHHLRQENAYYVFRRPKQGSGEAAA